MGCQQSKVVVSSQSISNPQTDMDWLDLQFHDKDHRSIVKPAELQSRLNAPSKSSDKVVLDRIRGSLMGLALGDALGAHVEFRPRQYLNDNPVTDLEGGGTWGLQKGQFTDDTSMALCLAASLVATSGFHAYDQLVRYKWWFRKGYMSSTGECFDIGASTRRSLEEFERRQKRLGEKYRIPIEDLDNLKDREILSQIDVYCGKEDAAGNGGLMRLAPVPLFFFRKPAKAVEYSGLSGLLTHGDRKARDACRFYGALITAAVLGESKDELLDDDFYKNHRDWFGTEPLDKEVIEIATGSYKKPNGYEDGIRGKGYVLESLRAALWAFWSDEGSFKKGALAAVNLGDDADTTAAIYGQLAGAYYGSQRLPQKWVEHLYARNFITCISDWLAYKGERWFKKHKASTSTTHEPQSKL